MRVATDPRLEVLTACGKAVLALTLALAPALAQAHPSHAEGGLWAGLLHPFHGFDHMAAAVAVGIWATRAHGRALWALLVAFLAAMTGGVAWTLAGLSMPAVEPLIAASVLLLGILVVLDARIPVAIGAALVVAFAPFHGAAHAVEMPAAGSALAFGCGVLAATAALHAAGIGATLALGRRRALLRVVALPVAAAGLGMLIARMA